MATPQELYQRVVEEQETRMRQQAHDLAYHATHSQHVAGPAGSAMDYDALRNMQRRMINDTGMYPLDGTYPITDRMQAKEISLSGTVLEFDNELYNWIFYKAKELNKGFDDIACGILMHHMVNEQLDLERDPVAKINAELNQMKEDYVDK